MIRKVPTCRSFSEVARLARTGSVYQNRLEDKAMKKLNRSVPSEATRTACAWPFGRVKAKQPSRVKGQKRRVRRCREREAARCRLQRLPKRGFTAPPTSKSHALINLGRSARRRRGQSSTPRTKTEDTLMQRPVSNKLATVCACFK